MIHRTPGSLGFAGQLLETGAGVTLGAKQSFARAQQSIPGLRHQAVILFAVGPAPIESAATPFPDVSQGSPNKSRHRRKNVLIYTVRGLVDPQRRDDQQSSSAFSFAALPCNRGSFIYMKTCRPIVGIIVLVMFDG
jgi:hypothetical protein